MSILDIKGERIANDTKRVHDPGFVEKRRVELSQILQRMKQGWMNDMRPDPGGATTPNVEAISQHWIEQWVNQCTVVMNSTDPIEVDAEAMSKWVVAQLRERKRQVEMAGALHDVTDLEPYGMKLLGNYHGGLVWVSVQAALHLLEGGMVVVHLKAANVGEGTYLRLLADAVNHLSGGWSFPHYTLGEFLALLNALRVPTLTPPTEEQMAGVREQMKP